MSFKAAKCPNCAGEIQVPDDRDNAKCMYCGSDIIVREAIKAAAGGVDIGNLLILAKHAREACNIEEAYNHYTSVLQYDSKNVEAWIGKGLTSHKFIKATPPRLELDPKAASMCFDNAISYSSNKLQTKNEIIDGIICNISVFDSRFSKNSDLYIYLSDIVCQTHSGPWNVCYYLESIYDIDNQNHVGLFIKAISASSASSCIKYFDMAIINSNYSDDFISAIITNISRVMYNIDRGFAYRFGFDAIDEFISFSHRIRPNDYSIDKRIITNIIAHPYYPQIILPMHSDKIKITRRNDLYHRLVANIQRQEPSYIPPELPGQKTGCFIATATYGSPMADEVVMLRDFRDNYLETKRWGQDFIKLYYRTSPPIAGVISKSKFLRAISRQILRPIVFVVKLIKL